MAEQFYTILTSIGKAKIANASALGNKVDFKYFALGDGNGTYYNPTESQERLVNEVWRGQIGRITVDEKNPNWIVIETIIPADQGGFMIREAGIIDEKDNLLAVGKYPETYKPQVQDGSAKDLYIKMILEVANTSVVNLKVDPTVILATKKDMEVLEQKMDKKIENIDIPVTEIIDNLNTDDSTKALSAKQGKTLQDTKMDKSGGTFTGTINMDKNQIRSVYLRGYGEYSIMASNVSGEYRMDFSASNLFIIDLSGSTKIVGDLFGTIGNLSATLFLVNGSGYPVSFSSGFRWINGEIPDLTISGGHVITITQRYTSASGSSGFVCFYGGVYNVS